MGDRHRWRKYARKRKFKPGWASSSLCGWGGWGFTGWDLVLMMTVGLIAYTLTKLRYRYPSFKQLFRRCYIPALYVHLENSGLVICTLAALFEIVGECGTQQYAEALPGVCEVVGCLMLIPYTYYSDEGRRYCGCVPSEGYGLLGILVMMSGSSIEVFMSGRWWALNVKGDDSWNADDQGWQKSAVCELLGFGAILFEFNIFHRDDCSCFFRHVKYSHWEWAQHFLGVLGILILCIASIYELLYGLYGACSTEDAWWWGVSGVLDILGLLVLSCAAIKGEDEDETGLVHMEYVAVDSEMHLVKSDLDPSDTNT